MTTKEVANLTGYALPTIQKYEALLQVKIYGTGNHKIYDWLEGDVERFQAAIRGADGSRDRRGETQKNLKKIQKIASSPLGGTKQDKQALAGERKKMTDEKLSGLRSRVCISARELIRSGNSRSDAFKLAWVSVKAQMEEEARVKDEKSPLQKLVESKSKKGKASWNGKILIDMATKRLVKPKYKRQQFLLSFIKDFKYPLTFTDFQKLLFLHITRNNLAWYDFVPYKYGGYSIQAAQDINTLEAKRWLKTSNGKIRYAGEDKREDLNFLFEEYGASVKLPTVRGKELVRLVYEQYPYYAINSKQLSLLDQEGIDRIQDEQKRLKQKEHMLFTIGYEGISVEKYLNTLIQNDVHVLCDVRNNPLSRKFGFSKNNLQKYLGDIGIVYVHLPELGIPSNKRQNLNGDENYHNLFDEYRVSIPKRQKSLAQVSQLLRAKCRVALTCFEHEPSHCHRHVIRDYLKETDKIETRDL
jgi:hypothetical protein